MELVARFERFVFEQRVIELVIALLNLGEMELARATFFTLVLTLTQSAGIFALTFFKTRQSALALVGDLFG